jgi:hypothetical protein
MDFLSVMSRICRECSLTMIVWLPCWRTTGLAIALLVAPYRLANDLGRVQAPLAVSVALPVKVNYQSC